MSDQEDERPTLSQRMVDAGFKRKPSWRSLPSDEEDALSDGWLAEAERFVREFGRACECKEEAGQEYWFAILLNHLKQAAP